MILRLATRIKVIRAVAAKQQVAGFAASGNIYMVAAVFFCNIKGKACLASSRCKSVVVRGGKHKGIREAASPRIPTAAQVQLQSIQPLLGVDVGIIGVLAVGSYSNMPIGSIRLQGIRSDMVARIRICCVQLAVGCAKSFTCRHRRVVGAVDGELNTMVCNLAILCNDTDHHSIGKRISVTKRQHCFVVGINGVGVRSISSNTKCSVNTLSFYGI